MEKGGERKKLGYRRGVRCVFGGYGTRYAQLRRATTTGGRRNPTRLISCAAREANGRRRSPVRRTCVRARRVRKKRERGAASASESCVPRESPRTALRETAVTAQTPRYSVPADGRFAVPVTNTAPASSRHPRKRESRSFWSAPPCRQPFHRKPFTALWLLTRVRSSSHGPLAALRARARPLSRRRSLRLSRKSKFRN